MPYSLAYADRFRRVLEAKLERDTDGSVPFASIPDDEPTDLIYSWTGKQFTKILSAAMAGADLMFPEDAENILWDLLKAIQIPPTPPDESSCIEYLPSAPFVDYLPDNPYVPNDKAAGWNKEAWFRWPEFDTFFPDFIDNWLNGFITSITGYLATDVLFNIESIPIDPINAFLGAGGLLPELKIRFSGTGVIEVGLLSFPLGGKAIIELDEEPNALDIITGGALDPGALLIELNRDIFNFPPDEYPVHNVEIKVDTEGDHILYIVFIPTVDDSLLPIGFGGGLRKLELCGFAEEGGGGVDNIFWNGCELVKVIAGVESVVVTAAQIQDCLDIPPAPGSGFTGIKGTSYGFEVATLDTTSTTMVQATNTIQSHQFTHENAIIIASAMLLNTNAGQNAFMEVRVNGVQSSPNANLRIGGNVSQVSQISGTFSGLDQSNPSDISLYFRCNASTARISAGARVVYTVIEYTNADDLFVEDIRIFEGELQKKLGGIWINVTDSLEAILASINSTASSALSQAAAATSAVAVANANASTALGLANQANTDNAAQDILINNLEVNSTIQGAAISVLDSRVDALEEELEAISDLSALEAISDLGVWSSTTTFDGASMPSGWFTYLSDGFFAFLGVRSQNIDDQYEIVAVQTGASMQANQLLVARVKISHAAGVNRSGYRIRFGLGAVFPEWTGSFTAFEESDTQSVGYIKIPMIEGWENFQISVWDTIEPQSEFYLTELKFMGLYPQFV